MEDYRISLAAARVNAGLSQKDLAKLMNVSTVTIVAWENGKRDMKMSQFKTFCELCNAPERCIIVPTISL